MNLWINNFIETWRQKRKEAARQRTLAYSWQLVVNKYKRAAETLGIDTKGVNIRMSSNQANAHWTIKNMSVLNDCLKFTKIEIYTDIMFGPFFPVQLSFGTGMKELIPFPLAASVLNRDGIRMNSPHNTGEFDIFISQNSISLIPCKDDYGIIGMDKFVAFLRYLDEHRR